MSRSNQTPRSHYESDHARATPHAECVAAARCSHQHTEALERQVLSRYAVYRANQVAFAQLRLTGRGCQREAVRQRQAGLAQARERGGFGADNGGSAARIVK